VVDRGLRDADGVGDHLERRPADAVIGEELEGGVDGVSLGGAVAGRSLPETGCFPRCASDRGRSSSIWLDGRLARHHLDEGGSHVQASTDQQLDGFLESGQ
jgi:hypothetical protein